MLPVLKHVTVTVVSLALSAATVVGKPVDRRIVDTVEAGNDLSESNHGYVGADATTGVLAGKTFRQTRGFMRYAMKTFDDTPLAVSCTFVGSTHTTFTFDLVVEDSLVATRTVTTSSAAPSVLEMAVPFAVTHGRTNVAIIIRARDGATPALQSLRTVQDHNEFQQ